MVINDHRHRGRLVAGKIGPPRWERLLFGFRANIGKRHARHLARAARRNSMRPMAKCWTCSPDYATLVQPLAVPLAELALFDGIHVTAAA